MSPAESPADLGIQGDEKPASGWLWPHLLGNHQGARDTDHGDPLGMQSPPQGVVRFHLLSEHTVRTSWVLRVSRGPLQSITKSSSRGDGAALGTQSSMPIIPLPWAHACPGSHAVWRGLAVSGVFSNCSKTWPTLVDKRRRTPLWQDKASAH